MCEWYADRELAAAQEQATEACDESNRYRDPRKAKAYEWALAHVDKVPSLDTPTSVYRLADDMAREIGGLVDWREYLEVAAKAIKITRHRRQIERLQEALG